MSSATTTPTQPIRYFMDHYTGSKEERVRAIFLKLKAISYTGKAEIHNDYQTILFEVLNGHLAASKSINSIADILDSLE